MSVEAQKQHDLDDGPAVIADAVVKYSAYSWYFMRHGGTIHDFSHCQHSTVSTRGSRHGSHCTVHASDASDLTDFSRRDACCCCLQ